MYLYPVYIPYYKRNFYFKEFTNHHYKQLVKTIISDDIFCFNTFVDKLLDELCDELDTSVLPAYDKFYIMLILRIMNIGSDLDFSYEKEENNFFKFKIDLVDVINKLDKHDITYNVVVELNNIKLHTSLPKHFINDGNILDTSLDCLNVIEISDKIIDVTNFTAEQKGEIIDNLPGNILPTLIKRLKKLDDIISPDPIISINLKEEDLPFDKEMYLSFFNNSFYQIIKMAFNTNLRDFYSYEYTLIKKFKFNYDHISKITPAELQVYFNVIGEDIEKEKREREKEENKDKHYQPPAGSDLSQFYPGEPPPGS